MILVSSVALARGTPYVCPESSLRWGLDVTDAVVPGAFVTEMMAKLLALGWAATPPRVGTYSTRRWWRSARWISGAAATRVLAGRSGACSRYA